MVRLKLPLTLALVAASATPEWLFAADVYRWTDSEGRTHFGDRPPAGGGTPIRVPQSAPTSDGMARQERTRRLLEEFASERAERAENAAKRARAETERAAACEEARGRRFEYENSRYLYFWDERGEKRVLGEAEHRRAQDEARQDVERWCE